MHRPSTRIGRDRPKNEIFLYPKFTEAGVMKSLLTKAKVKTVVHLLALCAVAVLAIPGEAYAFDAKDVPVLMYHKVDDVAPTTYWVSTDSFRDQMFLLHDLGYETVDLDDLYNHIQDVTELPAKPIILSFDDAYENAYTHALPLVSEQGFIGVADIGPTDYISSTDPSRQENLWDQPPEPTAWHLIWSEVNALYTAGWGIVAHSKTHGQLADMNIAEEVDSCNIIASEANIPVPNFYGYPFGQYSAALIQALQNEGYLGAMDASGGIENTGTTDIWHIKRMGVMREDTLAQFASNINETLPTIYRLTVNIAGDGSVQKNPDRPFYYNGNVVTLTAVADPIYKFDSWSGDLTGSNNPDSITMDSDKTVTASFVFDGVVLLDDGFEGTVWDANWNDNGVTAWTQDSTQKHSGSYSALAENNKEGYLTSDDLDAGDAVTIYVDFWFRKKNTEPNDFTLSYYNGTSYVDVAELDGLGAHNLWLHYTDVITDSNYFDPNFGIRFDATLAGGENAWVDDVLITKEIPTATPCDAANLDGAGLVNFKDVAILANDWRLTGAGLAGDIDWDEVVDFRDLDWIVDYWLSDCGQP
jgi:peptidoglycan/xylan/chitin deacetylase (PgdA/CDA1 family)